MSPKKEVNEEQRSPLKAKALRSPGQSCEEKRRQLLQDKIETPLILAVLMIVLTAQEFWRAYWNFPPTPWLFMLFAAGSVAFALYRLKVYLPEVRNLKLGAEGEKAVGQFLDRLRSDGYEVFHDVPGQAFNVDHVLIGPAGVFSIETKTWTKPRKGKAQIDFDGETLLKDGQPLDRDPIAQARAQSAWLQQLIDEGTGRKIPVRPIILVPGWWIEQSGQSTKEIWVLEPKALPSFLAHQPTRLGVEQIRLAAFHVSRYVRTFHVD